MNWDATIERNKEALKRILASLVAMAGFPVLRACGDAGIVGADTASPSSLRGGDRGGGSSPTLPRHLHRAVMRLLRPAEAAVRRLVIVAARDLILPPARPRKAEPKFTPILVRTHVDTNVLVPRYLLPQAAGVLSRPAPHTLALPLLDRLPRWGRRRRPAARGVLRISIPGLTARVPVPHPPSPDDPIDATRLALRVGALSRALDDLPREARRFARWRARRDTAAARISQELGAAGIQLDQALYGAGARNRKGRRCFQRFDPLRPGRPPGSRKRSRHEVHEVLRDLHQFALQALEQSAQNRAGQCDSS